MLLARLRTETADLHAAVERRVALGGAGLTAGRYVATLAAFYGFHLPWERAVRAEAVRAIASVPELGSVLDLMASRWRAADLEADLAFFDVDPGQIEVCADLPRLNSPARLLGSLYVMEGSTLGGQVVARQVERSLGLAGGTGYRYFRGHGDRAAPRWREFTARLVELARGLPEDDMVAGAADTFRALDRWFARSGTTGPGLIVRTAATAAPAITTATAMTTATEVPGT